MGEGYRGLLNTTRAQIACVMWNKTNSAYIYSKQFESNYCRNHDHSREPWCYIRTDTKTNQGENRTWQYCEVPMCSK